jgi:hypothetical protein
VASLRKATAQIQDTTDAAAEHPFQEPGFAAVFWYFSRLTQKMGNVLEYFDIFLAGPGSANPRGAWRNWHTCLNVWENLQSKVFKDFAPDCPAFPQILSLKHN